MTKSKVFINMETGEAQVQISLSQIRKYREATEAETNEYYKSNK